MPKRKLSSLAVRQEIPKKSVFNSMFSAEVSVSMASDSTSSGRARMLLQSPGFFKWTW
jgi:hypothetical protein